MLLRELTCACGPKNLGIFAIIRSREVVNGEHNGAAFEQNEGIALTQADEFEEQERIHNQHLHFYLDHESDPYERGDEFNWPRHQFDQWGGEFDQQPPVAHKYLWFCGDRRSNTNRLDSGTLQPAHS